MQFFRIDMKVKAINGELIFSSDESMRRSAIDRNLGEAISSCCERNYKKIIGKGYLFISEVSYGDCALGFVIRDYIHVDDYMEDIIKDGKLDLENIEVKETTFNSFLHILRRADRNDFVRDDYDILRDFDLDELANCGSRVIHVDFDEGLIQRRNKDFIYQSAKDSFTKESFIQELDRIYAGTPKLKVYGHPVDYMIESDDSRTQAGVTKLLIQALYDVGRIESRRYSVLELSSDEKYSMRMIDALFKACTGGTLILKMFENIEDEEDECANGSFYYLKDVCKIIRKHCCGVLTIIQLPKECTNLRMKILENVGDCAFIEIKEEQAIDKSAIDYLKNRAKKYHLRTDKELIDSVEKGHGYLITELNMIFDEWYRKKLKTSIFRQYKDISGAKSQIKEIKPKGSAYDELEAMIGLDSAKKMIQKALDSYKAQKLFKDRGLSNDPICNHMIFTGNPGTAKTSVARLFARILRDNNVISKGHIVEVGRSDLVGRFVGWTAPIVKKKFAEAVGGILFIDEAYSLVDDRDGMFGDEAINTIVQEMENHRNELIVIFAGYPDKMERFLDKNPGLRSRIAHYIHFEDYNTDELCRIASHIASQKGLTIDDGAMEKIKDIMDEARLQADFGNGRYVRNVIDKARMAQSSRLVHMDFDSISQDDIKTLRAEDIEIPIHNKKKANRIGFAV
ncbi:ATPase family associated with various cellular activities (AAA) [Lachnospiraceae bacterium]|nr:ATPase family associated with various cellular activities (AAA) [Lachnospiraceae bacterium]